MLTITRAEALYALAVAPFTLALLAIIVGAVAYSVGYKRAQRGNPYMTPWVRDGRAPGELPGCLTGASCERGDHTYSWPCDYAPGTGRLA